MKYKSKNGNGDSHKHYKSEGQKVKGKFTKWPMDHSMDGSMGKVPTCDQEKKMAREANIDKHPVFFTKE